ncbi:LOW QUALITY PROTEIN: hypothetical protein PHMEG_0001223 [Phytophthora megakarya]|uniref:Integrase catalytic domain-containing protein n=1 Tax=Phytophthora megakarya TaxID=4795 RepID=A0A225X264_9STRA|nr:LOW QUALITY PROTEIN: hypothetical protein PHMEG_0001223 [Phytophthora megakarya]
MTEESVNGQFIRQTQAWLKPTIRFHVFKRVPLPHWKSRLKIQARSVGRNRFARNSLLDIAFVQTTVNILNILKNHSSSKMTMMCLCIPHTRDNRFRTAIIECFHVSNIAAHPGAHQTYLRIAQWYHWLTLDQDTTCKLAKLTLARKNGKMIPIPIPEECWSVVSMDFVTGLPDSNSHDAIMTVVDKLSKRPKYCACNRTDDAKDVAHNFFDCVVRHHGVPSIIISDRYPKFISKFWSWLAKLMGVRLHMTTSYRAQADGQTERQNLILEDALR